MLFISASLTILFTALCASLILLVSLAKLLLPCRPLVAPAAGSTIASWACGSETGCNALVIRLTTRIDWQIEDNTRLRKRMAGISSSATT